MDALLEKLSKPTVTITKLKEVNEAYLMRKDYIRYSICSSDIDLDTHENIFWMIKGISYYLSYHNIYDNNDILFRNYCREVFSTISTINRAVSSGMWKELLQTVINDKEFVLHNGSIKTISAHIHFIPIVNQIQ